MKRWAWIFFAIVAIAAYFRLFFGVDLSDECQDVAQAYAPFAGGEFLKTDLLIQQTSAILIYPFLKVFVAKWGTSGLVLFLRHLYFILAFVTAFLSYDFLKRFYPPVLAILASSFFLAYIPISEPGWSYNTVAFFGFPLSLFLLFRGGSGLLGPIWGGIIASFTCFSYPPLALVYIFLVIRSLFAGQSTIPKPKIAAFFACLVIGGLITFLYFWSIGFENLARVLKFSQSFGELGGWAKISDTFWMFITGLKRGGLIALLLVVVATWISPWRRILSGKSNYIFWTAIVLATLSRIAPQRSESWLVYAGVIVLVFYRSLFSKRKTTLVPLGIIFEACGLCALIYAYSSGNVLINASLAFVLPIQLFILEMERLAPNRAQTKRFSLVILAIGLYLVINNYTYVFGDEPIQKLDTQVQSGPYKYLYTTHSRNEFIANIQNDLVELAKKNHSLFSSYLAAPYFMTSLKPVTGMLWVHQVQWTENQLKTVLYQTIEHGVWPDLVFTMKSDTDSFNYQFEKFFLASGRYSLLIDRTQYRIFGVKQ